MENFFLKDRQKVQKFVETKSFDLFIMTLICIDSIVLGLFTLPSFENNLGLYILDRLCMAIFIIEMILKLYVYGQNFFKSHWNTFDFSVIAVSSFSFASNFIILRAFRLFRLLKYINKFSKLKRLINVFTALMPNFVAFMLAFSVLLYVFAIMAVSLFGARFIEFSSLPTALFSLLQVFTLDAWASEIARPIMFIFPHAWIFFVSFVLISALLGLSFVMSVIDEIFRRDLAKDMPSNNLLESEKKAKKTKSLKKSVKKK